MRKWTMTAGLLFCAAASVYSNQAIGAKGPRTAKPADKAQPTDVKLIEEQVDPFATGDPSTQPTSQPTEVTPSSGGPAAPLQVNSDGTFSLNIVNGADLVEQLRVIGFQAQMSIIPSKDVRGALPAVDLYNVTASEALDALLHANGYAWRQKGNFVYVFSAKELAEMEKAQRVMNTEVFHVYYTPAANAVNMIKPVLSSDGQVSFTTPAVAGIEAGGKDAGGNSHATDDMMVVTDFPENLDRVRAVLKEVDRRPQQILIEATILRATLDEDNRLGVDLNVAGGVDFSTIQTSSGGSQITGAGIGTAGFGRNPHTVGTGNAFTNDILGGLKVGVVTNNVSVFVAALEEITDTVVMANPKVLALNKQKGEVLVGREDGYLTTTLTDTTATQTVEFLETGTRLIFRPFIGDDGYIRMEIHPVDSSGGLTADNLPFKFTTEVTSNVMVKDGHTIVIGGLFRESSESGRNQVPVLGNLPLVGNLFKQQRDRTVREEVIILLTPHIVKDDSVYAQLSEEQLRNAEKMRVGVRRGMMFWGRERMADLYYNCAVTEMSKPKPNRKKAIFFLDAATGLNPKFVEAVNLKQDLTGRELTTSDGSSIRSFVRKSMLVDRAPATQPTDRDIDALAPTAPSTQPLVEAPLTAAPATQPLAGSGKDLPFEFGADGFQPATQPTDLTTTAQRGVSLREHCLDCEEAARPLAETDMEMPSFVDVEPMHDDSHTRSSRPLARSSTSTGAATQPSAQVFGVFGIRGLGSAMSQMMRQAEAQQTESADGAVTELPFDEVDGGNK